MPFLIHTTKLNNFSANVSLQVSQEFPDAQVLSSLRKVTLFLTVYADCDPYQMNWLSFQQLFNFS